jgi:hypothetical protein
MARVVEVDTESVKKLVAMMARATEPTIFDLGGRTLVASTSEPLPEEPVTIKQVGGASCGHAGRHHNWRPAIVGGALGKPQGAGWHLHDVYCQSMRTAGQMPLGQQNFSAT